MAGLAGFGAYVECGIGGTLVFTHLLAGLGFILILFSQPWNNQQAPTSQAGDGQDKPTPIELPLGAHLFSVNRRMHSSGDLGCDGSHNFDYFFRRRDSKLESKLLSIRVKPH